MKAEKIIYKRTFRSIKYLNEEIGIELIVEEGEKASDVLEQAKLWVENFSNKHEIEENHKQALKIIKNKENETLKSVKDAKELIKSYSGIQKFSF